MFSQGLFSTISNFFVNLFQKGKKLKEAKDRLLKLAIEKEHAINVALKQEVNKTQERADYLNSLNILLQRAIRDLKADIA